MTSTPQTEHHEDGDRPAPLSTGNTAPPEGARCSLVVGLGASAGGLDPLQLFFANIPRNTDAAFVVVQHLSPDFKSVMQELLARHTELSVRRATDGMALEPNAIYLNPPAKNMHVRDGQLRLTDQDLSRQHGPNFPIDRFFESLAEEFEDRAVGVILSGTGTDGTRGIRAINEAGGLVLAQDTDSAQFDGMPRSAAGTGLVHHVLPPEELAAHIARIARHVHKEPTARLFTARQVHQEHLDTIINLLREDGQIDFSHYKSATLARRVERRMMISGISDTPSYIDKLDNSPEECRALRRDLLISVTSFLRDEGAWRILASDVIPRLAANVSPTDPLRVWVTACATGEEVYSLAMLLYEHLESIGKSRDVKIFATDIDTAALETAAAGSYPESIVSEIGPDRVKKFFTRVEGRYRVIRPLREMIIFARHDLTKDSPFTKMHLVLCRNVLIYMQSKLQQRVLGMLHFSLRPGGILFLGTAETVGDLEPEFRTLSGKWHIYEKRRDVLLPISRDKRMTGQLDPVLSQQRRNDHAALETTVTEAFGASLRERGAACLLVDTNDELTHTFGDANAYLTLPEGKRTATVTRLLPRELSLAVTAAIHRVRSTRHPVTHTGIQVRPGQDEKVINVRVTHHTGGRATGDFVMIYLEPSADEASAPSAEPLDVESQAAQRIRELEQELRQTRENLQATIEELETTNEEQQATNEELLAANEELQSTNEELHSVNEELHTVNAEYQTKIQQLTDLNNDMDNLLKSTDIGTVFLDAELSIRKFTPAVTQVINLIDQDIGRPFEHISQNFDASSVPTEARRVLDTGRASAREVQTRDGRWFLMGLHPYRTDDQRTSGIVLTFVDISDVKRMQDELHQAHNILESRTREVERANNELSHLAALVESSDDAIVSKSLDGTIRTWNAAAERLYGYAASEAIGRNFAILMEPAERAKVLEVMEQARQGTSTQSFESLRRTKTGETVYVSVNISPIRDAQGEVSGVSAISRDITAERVAAEAQRISEERYRAAAENSFDAFLLLECVRSETGIDDFRVIDTNRHTEHLLKRNRGDIVARRLCDLLPTLKERGLYARYTRVIETGEPFQEEVALGDEVPDVGWIAHQVVSVGDGIAITARDITARKEREQQEQQRVSAELAVGAAASAEMDAFLHSASHDLRAPLVSLQGFTSRLEKSLAQLRDALAKESDQTPAAIADHTISDITDAARHIRNSVDRCSSIIDGLLRVSRTGREDLRPGPIDMRALAERVVSVASHEIRQRKAQVTIGDLPPAIGDPDAVDRIVSNLLSNALKFLDEQRPGRIELGYSGCDAGRNIYFVRDNGLGIAPEDHLRIFDLFRRLHPDRADGEGLGLAIVKRLVERHGGQVRVESTPDKGSTFAFSLEAAPPNEEPAGDATDG